MPTGRQYHCEDCSAFQPARLAKERDAVTRREYFDLVCKVCASILLQRGHANAHLLASAAVSDTTL